MIHLLMSSSEHISMGLETHKYGHRCLGDADILLRVLCHKKDREASEFLKQHYQLPASSGKYLNPYSGILFNGLVEIILLGIV